jgi:hypothetical protein
MGIFSLLFPLYPSTCWGRARKKRKRYFHSIVFLVNAKKDRVGSPPCMIRMGALKYFP